MERSVSIFFLPYVHGAADDLWLIPYTARQDPDVFEINVSNPTEPSFFSQSV